MPSSEKDDLPSYSEALEPPHSIANTSSSTSTSRGLVDNLTLARAHTIRCVIDEHILPLVENEATLGIPQTTIALLPSDIPLPAPEEKNEFSFDASTTFKQVEVIGFNSEEEPKIARLSGPMNNTKFWRLEAVVEELERTLRERLNQSEKLRSPTSPVFERGQLDEMSRSSRRQFFGRFSDSIGRHDRTSSPPKALDHVGQVLVKVRLEEICLRTVNDFGLYDTMSRQCVIVRVDVRC